MQNYGGGFGDYISSKRAKIAVQNDEFPVYSSIFKGITIYVNGYTLPSQHELREMICSHGGAFQFHLSPSVTHIVSNNRPAGSRSSWNKVVVRPEWIIDSVREGKVRKTFEYCLEENNGKDKAKQQKISWNNIQEEKEDVNEYAEEDHVLDSIPIHAKALVATDPNFLENYYKSSRLHFLSTWKAELAAYTAQLFTSKPQRPPLEFESRVIMHVDMDCFFASVSLKDKPEWMNEPVAVCHSKNNESTSANSYAEISSCNYIARSYGLHNGQALKKAIEKCPNLKILPYEFEKYKETALIVARILVDWADMIQPVSIDESYIEVTSRASSQNTPIAIAEAIREQIFKETGCTASIGIGSNMLLARLATTKAKPNGSYFVNPSNQQKFLKELDVKSLPGIGWSLADQCKALNISTIGDMQEMSLLTLKEHFGAKFGLKLYNSARGIDDRQLYLQKERKSIGSEISWGIRFTVISEVMDFINRLCVEISERMKTEKVTGRSLNVKIMLPLDPAVKPKKFLGSGMTENFSKSGTLPSPSNDSNVLYCAAKKLIEQFEFEPQLLRGIGIHVQKLASVDTKSIKDMFLNAKEDQQSKPRNLQDFCALYEFDQSVLENLPNDVCLGILKEKNCSHLIPLVSSTSNVANADDNLNEFQSMNYTISQLDESVLADLPSDIRNEVLSAANFAAINKSPNTPVTPFRTPTSASKSVSKRPSSSIKKRLFSNTPERNPTLTQTWGIGVDSTMGKTDREVFLALPKDVRLELLQSMKSASKRELQTEISLKAFEKEHYKLLYSTEDQSVRLRPLKFDFFGRTTLEEWKEIISQWMSVPAPMEEDIRVFKGFLRTLLDHKCLECVQQLLLFMKLRLNLNWQPFFDDIVLSVQQSVLSEYKSYLLL